MSTLPMGADSAPSSSSSSSSWWGFVSSIAHQSEYLLDSVAKEVNHLQHSLTEEAAKLFQETTDKKEATQTHEGHTTEEKEHEHFVHDKDKRETGRRRSTPSEITPPLQQLNHDSSTPGDVQHPNTTSSQSLPAFGVIFSSIEEQLVQWSADIDKLSETLWNDAHRVLPSVFSEDSSPQLRHIDESYRIYLTDPTSPAADERSQDTADTGSLCNYNDEYNDWTQSFYEGWLLGWQSMCAELLLDQTAAVYQAHQQLVPHYMDEQTFFARYWWRQKQLGQYHKAITTPRVTGAGEQQDDSNDSTTRPSVEEVTPNGQAAVVAIGDPMLPANYALSGDTQITVAAGSQLLAAEATALSDPLLHASKDCQPTMLQVSEQSSDDEEEDVENEDGWIDVHEVAH